MISILPVQAYSSSSDHLAKYQKRLDELNHILETGYALLPDRNISDEEMTGFLQGMTISEFDDYIYSLHDSDMEFKKNELSITRQKIDIPNNSVKNTKSDNRQLSFIMYIQGSRRTCGRFLPQYVSTHKSRGGPLYQIR